MNRKIKFIMGIAIALCASSTFVLADEPGSSGGHGNTGHGPHRAPAKSMLLTEGHGSNGKTEPQGASTNKSGGGGGPKSTGSGGPKFSA